MAHKHWSTLLAPGTARRSHPLAQGRQHPHSHSFVFLLSSALLVLVLAGCGGSTSGASGQGSTPKTGGTLNVGLIDDVVTLDPLKSSALVDREVLLNMYDTLVKADNQNVIQPDLATSWTFSTPTTLDFTLRSDVKFQDGTPFDAQAVADNINRILTAKASPRRSELSSVDSVLVTDPTHVQFKLKKPFTPLLAALTDRAGIIISPQALKSYSDTQLATAPKNAGSGPFMLDSWVKGDHLTLLRNPTYWQKDSAGRTLPYLDKVIYKGITNGSVRYNNLQAGTINVAEELAPADVASAKTNSSLIYNQTPGLSFYGMMLNTKVAPFNDVHARNAVAWAVNRAEIVSGVFKGTVVAAQGPIPPSSWAYDKTFQPYTTDVSKAKAELAQSSAASGLTFTFLIDGGSPVASQLAQFIQSELATAGITMEIKQETFASILSDTDAGSYQAASLGWSGRPDPDGNMYNWFHTGGGFNQMAYSNAQVDSLLEDARLATDQAKRAQDYQDAQKLIAQESPYVFLYTGTAEQATTKSVHNFALAPTTIMLFASTYLA